MKRSLLRTIPLALLLLLLAAPPISAHQPFFEEEDITFAAPWIIRDPSVSTVVYATLESATDVDYYAFEGAAGQRVLLSLTIPQIEGQDDFAPTMALLGPGLPESRLPRRVERPAGGAREMPPAPGPASTFFEPFSRTSYWERQEEWVTLPERGRYLVAVWHPEGAVGRYGFVIGHKERIGGELIGLGGKLRAYWTPVVAPAGEEMAGKERPWEHMCGMTKDRQK